MNLQHRTNTEVKENLQLNTLNSPKTLIFTEKRLIRTLFMGVAFKSGLCSILLKSRLHFYEPAPQ